MNFTPHNSRPASQGTRVHQMALYVIYESPLQMLADSPSQYRKEQECTDFISDIPVVWDDIHVAEARIGDYLLMARRSGDNWYVGGLTDWTEREMELDLSFLPAGKYRIEIFSDGINADRYAEDYRHTVTEAGQGEKIKLKMAPGGGWVARISPK
ncbi:MAG TPA: glycoside hydrolase family 97 C-terminal domain-containing protein, partial [Synergistales bacterium]|nr:glycoside hydrolase family 97 C-terminal domain-containing protein [Synergistales bacterium]